MPRRNRRSRRPRPRTDFAVMARPERTPQQMALDLVRRGLATPHILGPRPNFRPSQQSAEPAAPNLKETR